MALIRPAKENDLDAMIDLWAEARNWEFKNPRFGEDWFGPTVSYVVHLADRWKREIEQGMVTVIIKCREVAGFCVTAAYTPQGEAPECLFINEVYIAKWIQEPELATQLIIHVGKKALEDGYQRMCIGISSAREDNLKEQCIRLGAKFTWMQGLNYSYIENYEWKDLRCFAKMEDTK